MKEKVTTLFLASQGVPQMLHPPYVTISIIGIISTSMEIINHIKLTMKIDSPSPTGTQTLVPLITSVEAKHYTITVESIATHILNM